MKIIEQLKSTEKQNKKLAILLRHSDRYDIKKSEFGNDVLLNPQGIEKAKKFGEELRKYKVNKIYTSPIERCVQTAENIVIGYSNKIEIIKTKALGDPGIHISNEDLLGQYYLKFGFWKIFENFKNNIPVDGLFSKEQVKEKFDNFLLENTMQEGITLYITHDWQIAFYAYAKQIKEFTKNNWIDYLEGLIIKFS
jgi:hypothetical protein